MIYIRKLWRREEEYMIEENIEDYNIFLKAQWSVLMSIRPKLK